MRIILLILMHFFIDWTLDISLLLLCGYAQYLLWCLWTWNELNDIFWWNRWSIWYWLSGGGSFYILTMLCFMQVDVSCNLVPQETCSYQLVSVVEHFGKAGSGHYTVYRSVRVEFSEDVSDDYLNQTPMRWFCISDSQVHAVSVEGVLSSEASLLFYERIPRNWKNSFILFWEVLGSQDALVDMFWITGAYVCGVLTHHKWYKEVLRLFQIAKQAFGEANYNERKLTTWNGYSVVFLYSANQFCSLFVVTPIKFFLGTK